MSSLEFSIPVLPKLQADSFRSVHARNSYRKKWHKRVADELLAIPRAERPASPLDSAELTFTRYSTRQPDRTNLVSSFKPVEDGLVLAGVIRDDSPDVVGEPLVCWKQAKRGNGSICVRVEW